MDPFEEPARRSMIPVEKAAEYAADAAKVATAVQGLFKHEGWAIFVELFNKRSDEVKDRDDYTSLEDFKADRRAIKQVEELVEELRSYIDDASRADELFNKIISAEGQTPRSMVDLATGEHTEA